MAARVIAHVSPNLRTWSVYSRSSHQRSMVDVLDSSIVDRVKALKATRTHVKNLSWGGQGTPLSRKLSASPKVVSALASTFPLHQRTSSLKNELTDVALDFRIAKHASGSLSMDLFRVPEEKMEQNADLLERVFDRDADCSDIASAVAQILLTENIEVPPPGTPKRETDFVPVVVAHTPISKFDTSQKGEAGSFDYRLFLKIEDNHSSFWHDIPLDNGDGTVNFVCEIPKETRAKMEVATTEANNPIKQDIKKGKLREYPYNIHWNYGMLPRTWEDPDHKNEDLGGITGDNDPVDVVEIGSEQLLSGSIYKVKVLGAYAMIDEGELDWKIIAIRADDPMAQYLDDIDDVERRMEGVLEQIMIWFRDYKIPDGKPANKFGFDNKPQSKKWAEEVIQETHGFYQDLVDGKRSDPSGLAL